MFSEIFGQVGLVPDMAGTYLLPRIVGRSKAKEIVLTYRKISAVEAKELGIVHELCKPEELEARVNAWAEKFAAGPTFAFGMAKSMINRSFETDIHTALELENMAQSVAMMSHDHKEGVSAFINKRKPEFKGM